mmetsp:Transcript_70361/g.178432  ORF Transcript_70361/g.178432 Transcript_70361/m.178432 type:complete len:240 (+) Transcript_70361:803-1522(+)
MAPLDLAIHPAGVGCDNLDEAGEKVDDKAGHGLASEHATRAVLQQRPDQLPRAQQERIVLVVLSIHAWEAEQVSTMAALPSVATLSPAFAALAMSLALALELALAHALAFAFAEDVAKPAPQGSPSARCLIVSRLFVRFRTRRRCRNHLHHGWRSGQRQPCIGARHGQFFPHGHCEISRRRLGNDLELEHHLFTGLLAVRQEIWHGGFAERAEITVHVLVFGCEMFDLWPSPPDRLLDC